MKTSAKVVEMSDTIHQTTLTVLFYYSLPDDQTTRLNVIPGFKPLTVLFLDSLYFICSDNIRSFRWVDTLIILHKCIYLYVLFKKHKYFFWLHIILRKTSKIKEWTNTLLLHFIFLFCPWIIVDKSLDDNCRTGSIPITVIHIKSCKIPFLNRESSLIFWYKHSFEYSFFSVFTEPFLGVD